jgi:hypothetical protein
LEYPRPQGYRHVETHQRNPAGRNPPSPGPSQHQRQLERLVSDAVLRYVSFRGKTNLAEQIKPGALANAQRDLEIAQEWFPAKVA